MSDTKRLAKQLIYGGFYLAIILLISYGIYVRYLKAAPSCFDNKQNQGEEGIDCGGPCQSCEISKLKPIAAESAGIFNLNGAVALLEFNNPNPGWGADKLPYEMNLHDNSGKFLGVIHDETFIYPGERKFLVKKLDGYADVSEAEITLGQPEWKSSADFPQTKLEFLGLGHVTGASAVFVSGDIKNNETVLLPKIVIGASFFDHNGNLVAVSATEVYDVRAFEERFFQIAHPYDSHIDLDKTRLFFEAKRL